MWNYGNPQKPISFGFFCTNSAGRFKTPILDLKVANQLIEHVATFVTRSSLVSISIWKHLTWLIKQSLGINVLLQWRHYGNPHLLVHGPWPSNHPRPGQGSRDQQPVGPGPPPSPTDLSSKSNLKGYLWCPFVVDHDKHLWCFITCCMLHDLFKLDNYSWNSVVVYIKVEI